ncbi:MAG TPA: class I SAM-dependent methyltransferase [Albitalea sp.]
MSREHFTDQLHQVLDVPATLRGNFAIGAVASADENQQQTNEAFSDKWARYDESGEQERLYAFQRQWYLRLYGFGTEEALARHLRGCRVIFDAGCGLGYKAAWFAGLAPEALVIGMDFSGAARQAAERYAALPNLFFIQGDIARTGFRDGSVDYASCDQVIMHTESPERTFAELARITRAGGEVACYFYAKKALPRELLDDYFRIHCKEMDRERLWQMSEQLTELGRRLSALNVSFEAPDIPELGIKGGTYDIQRFVYWNFLKCFWNPELGRQTSVVTNFDWYSPSNARRFSEREVRALVAANGLADVFFHAEEACWSGRFAKA